MTQRVSVGGTGATGRAGETLSFAKTPEGLELLASYISSLTKKGIKYRLGEDFEGGIEVIITGF